MDADTRVRRVPRVKVCGLTRAADVRAALDAGADALGFVHHAPSPRSLDARQAGELIELVPAGALAIAVMVDATPASASAFLHASGARTVQLCGSEDAREWADFAAPILRRLAVTKSAVAELEDWKGIAHGFVLDHPAGPGGTGRSVDVELATRLARAAPCLLAGGLAPDTVAGRVALVRPAGVDASTGLESAPGRKDVNKVRAFVREALRAFTETDDAKEEQP